MFSWDKLKLERDDMCSAIKNFFTGLNSLPWKTTERAYLLLEPMTCKTSSSSKKRVGLTNNQSVMPPVDNEILEGNLQDCFWKLAYNQVHGNRLSTFTNEWWKEWGSTRLEANSHAKRIVDTLHSNWQIHSVCISDPQCNDDFSHCERWQTEARRYTLLHIHLTEGVLEENVSQGSILFQALFYLPIYLLRSMVDYRWLNSSRCVTVSWAVSGSEQLLYIFL